jgi:hypothetical protein
MRRSFVQGRATAAELPVRPDGLRRGRFALENVMAYIILSTDDPQVRDLLQQRLERDGHYVLDENERPEGADPRHVFCELITTKADAQELVGQFRRDFPNVRAVVIG